MQRAFDSAAAMKLLSEGLLKANPSNPDIPMWTVEDFDEEPRGLRYSRQTWEKHPACQRQECLGEGFIGTLWNLFEV